MVKTNQPNLQTPPQEPNNDHLPDSSSAELLGSWIAALQGRPGAGRRRVLVIVISLLVLMGASGILVWAALHRYPAASGELVVGYKEPVATIDPVGLVGAPPGAGVAVSSLIFETLVVKGVNGETMPGLAETWRVSPDGRQIRFRLAAKRQFSDGAAVDAAAVKASLERFASAVTTPSPGAGPAGGGEPGRGGKTGPATVGAGLGPLSGITVEKPQQLLMTFAEPYPALWTVLSSPAAAIARPSSDEPGGLTGSGPYRLKTFEAGGAITLTAKANPPRGFIRSFLGRGPTLAVAGSSTAASPPASGPARYWRALTGRPASVVFKHFADASALQAAVQSSAVTLAYPAAGDEAAFSGQNEVTSLRPTGELLYMGLNTASGLFKDAAARQAAASAVNRASLVKTTLAGRAVPSDHLWPDLAQLAEGQGQSSIYKEDPAEAKQLLEKGGQTTPVDLGLLTLNYRDALATAKAVAAQLDAAGFRTKVTPMDGTAFFRRLDAGEFQAYVLSFRWSDPGILYDLLHSSRAGLANRTRYANPQADAQLDALVTKVDPEARCQALRQTEAVVLKDAPWIPLAALERPVVAGPAWQDVAFGAHGELWLDLAHPAAP